MRSIMHEPGSNPGKSHHEHMQINQAVPLCSNRGRKKKQKIGGWLKEVANPYMESFKIGQTTN